MLLLLIKSESFMKNWGHYNFRWYYKHALLILDTALDTMNVKSERYNLVKLNKAVVLILLGQKKAGDKIIQDVYDNETLYSNKQ